MLQDLNNQQYRITEVNLAADKLIDEGHPDAETIHRKKEVCMPAILTICVSIYCVHISCVATLPYTR